MARFYGSTQGERGETTRLGHRRIRAEARGWDSGVRIVGEVDGNGQDVFYVYATHGSNDPSGVLVGRVVADGHFVQDSEWECPICPGDDDDCPSCTHRGRDYDLARDMRRGK